DRYIIPVDLDNIPPAKGLKYFLGSCQWFPASNPMELEQLEELVQAIKRAIGRFDDAPVDDSGQRQAVARTEIDDAIQRPPPPQQSKAWLGWVFAALIVAAVAVFGFWKPFWRSADPGGNGNSPDTSSVVAYDDTSTTRLVTGDPPVEGVNESPIEVVTPPATGTFSITSTPDKASIWLNGQRIGQTPHRNHEITAGRYDIKLAKEGYRTTTKELIVEAGTSTSLEVALNRFTADLQVKTTPDGVEVVIDGQQKGVTPCTVQGLAEGPHPVILRKDGYRQYEETVTIDRSADNVFTRSLTAIVGRVTVQVLPTGLIYIDGAQKTGQESNAPQSFELLPGTYTIEGASLAWGSWPKQIEVLGDEVIDVTFDFSQEFTMTITSKPVYAQIFINGANTGKYTPSQLRLHPGKKRIHVAMDGYVMVDSPREMILEGNMEEPIPFVLQRNR
ncbi:MAG: PEGA domain-containing protein, partial [bacterium]